MTERRRGAPSNPESGPVSTITSLNESKISFANGKPYGSWTLIEMEGLPFVAVAYKVGSSDQPWGTYMPLPPVDFTPPYALPRISTDEEQSMLTRMGVNIEKIENAEEVHALLKSELGARTDSYKAIYQKFYSDPDSNGNTIMKSEYRRVVNEACKDEERKIKERLALQGEV